LWYCRGIKPEIHFILLQISLRKQRLYAENSSRANAFISEAKVAYITNKPKHLYTLWSEMAYQWTCLNAMLCTTSTYIISIHELRSPVIRDMRFCIEPIFVIVYDYWLTDSNHKNIVCVTTCISWDKKTESFLETNLNLIMNIIYIHQYVRVKETLFCSLLTMLSIKRNIR